MLGSLLVQNTSLTLWCHRANGKRKRAGQESESDETLDSADVGLSRKGGTKKRVDLQQRLA